MSLISHPAPSFAIPAVAIKATRPWVASLADYAGSWLMLLFYPRDFSFVCPTELTSFSARASEFEQRNCQILGVSVDSIESHTEWLSTPPAQGGLGPLQFPLGSDPDGEFAKKFDIWLPEKGVSTRGLYLIDPAGILQYGVVHNLSVGRNVDETLRVLDALQSGGLCQAGWTTADGNIDPEKAIEPGRVLGHYRIERLLGEGTFASVVAALDLRLERQVALKLLKRNSIEWREAALREARTAASLSHPNVCGIYAVEEEDGLPIIAMEYVDGRPLSDLINETISLESIVDLAHGIASGLAAAHAMQIVHGDLKPANVLVTTDLTPRILDFGLARQTNRADLPNADSISFCMTANAGPPEVNDLDATMQGTPVATAGELSRGISGTPAYMSLEQWRGEPTSPASDVFAFGLMLYELMAGRRALNADNPAGLLAKLQDPQLPVSLASEIPEQFRELLVAMLATEPASRPTADAVQMLLKA